MKVLAAVFLALSIMITCASNAIADVVDRADPIATAQAFLTAFKAKDLNMMAVLVNSTNKDIFEDLAAKGESSRAYNEVFGGWRYEAATAAATVGETVKYNRRGEGLVMFHQMEGDEVAVFVLTNEDGVWGIEDINSPTRADFEAMPTSPAE